VLLYTAGTCRIEATAASGASREDADLPGGARYLADNVVKYVGNVKVVVGIDPKTFGAAEFRIRSRASIAQRVRLGAAAASRTAAGKNRDDSSGVIFHTVLVSNPTYTGCCLNPLPAPKAPRLRARRYRAAVWVPRIVLLSGNVLM